MKNQTLKKLLALVILITLVMFQIVYAMVGVVEAVYEELEAQGIETNNENISFDAFLKDGENTIHSKQANIQTGETLNVRINVSNGTVFNNGKIKLLNDGIYIDKDKLQNEYVKSVNSETGEIELNQIANNTQVEIAIPVKLKTSENINIDYFNKETTVNLTGECKIGDKSPRDVEGNKNVRIIWTDDTEVQLDQSIEKYISIKDKSTILQQVINTTVLDNKLPRKEEIIEVQAPQIQEQYPERVVVLQNGQKISDDEIEYNKENGSLVIKNINEVSSENTVKWNEAKETYKIIYHYPATLEITQTNIHLKTVAKTTLYTKEEVSKTDEKDVAIAQMGSIVTLSKEMTPSVYKGYLYANKNQTEYQENLHIEISDVQEPKELETSNVVDNYVFETGEELADTYYKEIILDKQQLKDILGEDFSVQIINGEDTIATINKDTQETDGKVKISLDEKNDKITIKTNAPVKEGNIDITLNKYIKAQTDYTKEQLKTFTALKTTTRISSGEEANFIDSQMELKDTVPEVSLEINQNEWSTLQTNQNVQINATLKSNDIMHDLYKNPVINLQLPKEIQSINVYSINKLYADEMKVASARFYEDEKRIEIILQGEQTEFENSMNKGIQIVVNADITMAKTQPTKDVKIEMTATNENRANETIKAEIPVRLASRDGAVLYNSIESFNNANEKLETVEEETIIANLDRQSEAKNAKISTTIVNNYPNSMQNVIILGKLPELEEGAALRSTIFTNLLEKIAVGKEGAKIYYSTEVTDANSDKWQENVDNLLNVKMFKIEIPEISTGEVIPINYSIGIPENIDGGENAYVSLILNYLYDGQTIQTYSNIKLQTEEVTEESTNEEQSEDRQENQNEDKDQVDEEKDQKPVDVTEEEKQEKTVVIEENVQGLDIKVDTSTPGKDFSIQEDVYEGQTIKHRVTITNNTGKDLNNFTLEGTQTDEEGNRNATFFGIIEQHNDHEMLPDVTTTYREDESIESKKFTKDVLVAGETIEYEYEFSINQIKKDGEKTIGKLLINADDFSQEKIIMDNTIKQADLKLTVMYSFNEETPLTEGNETIFQYKVTNLSDQKLENVQLNINLPDGVDTEQMYFGDAEYYKYISNTDKIVTVELVNPIEPGQSVQFPFYITIGVIPEGQLEKSYTFSMSATLNNITYNSNEIIKTISKTLYDITAEQKGSVEGDTIRELDEVQFITTIKNNSERDTSLTIFDEVPDMLIVEEAYVESNGERIATADIEAMEENILSVDCNIQAGQEIQFILKTHVDYNLYGVEEVENYVEIVLPSLQTITPNTVKYKLDMALDYTEDDETENPGEENPDGEETNNVGSISGVAWIDSNKNGIKDEEQKLTGMDVVLIDNNTSQIAKNSTGQEMQTTTNSLGAYTFDNLMPGSYLVAFRYDNKYYEVTKYQTDDASQEENSDVVSKTISLNGNDEIVAITNQINSNNDEINNVDAGFCEREIFDLAIEKTIKKISLQTSKQTKEWTYDNTSLAKVDIRAKEIVNSIVTVQYNIRVTNEGEVAGYAKQIVDYIPQGLGFDTKLNPGWKLSQDGNIYNDSLSNTKIEPGEYKEVTLTLTKKMTENSFGTVVNMAEIEEGFNDISVTDVDSTPGNKKDGEDDISSAELIISVSTGTTQIIFTIIVITVILLVTGGIIYKKRREGV